jgi:hypothetical protein
MKKPAFPAFALFCICCSLLPQAAWPQGFSSINRDLAELERLIQDTLENSEAQIKQLEDLQNNLAESGELIRSYETIIQERENLLRGLQERLSEMSEIYKTQSALSARYEKSSRFWRNFTLIAVPSAALLGGGLAWALKK